MQHHKISTRLLDWTENAMLALYFAICIKSLIEENARVWFLDPFKLNDFTINKITGLNKSTLLIPSGDESNVKSELINSDGQIVLSELTRRYLKMDFVSTKDQNEIFYYPLAIYPPYLNARMAAQKTGFTIFVNKINGLFSLETNSIFLSSIIIEGGSAKNRILSELRMLGIDHESILPDLDGMGESINCKFEPEMNDTLESMEHCIKYYKKN